MRSKSFQKNDIKITIMSKNYTPLVYKAHHFYNLFNMATAKKAAKKAAPKKKATKSKGKK